MTTWTNAVGAAAVADGGTLAITNQLPAGFTGLSAIGGGEVTYLGTIDNTAKTFFLDTLPAGLRFAGGRITGGTVTTSGGAAYVLPAGSFYRLDSAIVQTDLIINAGTSLELLGGWVNDGTLTLAGGSIHLGGSFTTANLGKLSRTGGIVNLTGAYDLQGGTLAARRGDRVVEPRRWSAAQRNAVDDRRSIADHDRVVRLLGCDDAGERPAS